MASGGQQRMSMAPGAYASSRGRMSIAPSSGSAAHARLAAKQAELQALQHLRNESASLAQEMALLGDRVDTLVTGGSAVASVMASWNGVFRAIQIAQGTCGGCFYNLLTDAATTAASRELDAADEAGAGRGGEDGTHAARDMPDALVRIPMPAPPRGP
ncbi:DASH complex subunit dad2 [Malassezia sp. CBS 17886]|nr:DASH complex subunit dad2 [Malassezia sp. CBS 17886]